MPLPNPPLTRTEKVAAYLSVTEEWFAGTALEAQRGAWSKRGKIVRYDVNDLVAFLANGRQARKREESGAVTVYVR